MATSKWQCWCEGLREKIYKGAQRAVQMISVTKKKQQRTFGMLKLVVPLRKGQQCKPYMCTIIRLRPSQLAIRRGARRPTPTQVTTLVVRPLRPVPRVCPNIKFMLCLCSKSSRQRVSLRRLKLYLEHNNVRCFKTVF